MLPGNIDLTENLDFRNVKRPKEHHPGPALPYKNGLSVGKNNGRWNIDIYDRDHIVTYMSDLVTEINTSSEIVDDTFYVNDWATTAYDYQTGTVTYDVVSYNRRRYDYYTIDSTVTTLTVSTTSSTSGRSYVTYRPSTTLISHTEQAPELESIFGKYRNPEFDLDNRPALCWGNGSRNKEIDTGIESNTRLPWGGLVREVANYFNNDDEQLAWGHGLDSREFDNIPESSDNIVDRLPYLSNMSIRELKAHFDELYDKDMSSYLTNMNWLGIRDIETSIAAI